MIKILYRLKQGKEGIYVSVEGYKRGTLSKVPNMDGGVQEA